MNNEVAVPEPLSGTEIVEAIVFKVREMLRRDCFLSPNSAYEYFSGQIHIEVTAVDCGRPAEIKADIDVTKGTTDPDNPELYTAESTEKISPGAPNIVRRETEQSVPVVTNDGAGKQEQRRVKYARQDKEIPRGGSKAKHKGHSRAAAGKGRPQSPAA